MNKYLLEAVNNIEDNNKSIPKNIPGVAYDAALSAFEDSAHKLLGIDFLSAFKSSKRVGSVRKYSEMHLDSFKKVKPSFFKRLFKKGEFTQYNLDFKSTKQKVTIPTGMKRAGTVTIDGPINFLVEYGHNEKNPDESITMISIYFDGYLNFDYEQKYGWPYESKKHGYAAEQLDTEDAVESLNNKIDEFVKAHKEWRNDEKFLRRDRSGLQLDGLRYVTIGIKDEDKDNINVWFKERKPIRLHFSLGLVKN